ncbi:hypothetical protein D3C74_400290 [compost metagenome]
MHDRRTKQGRTRLNSRHARNNLDSYASIRLPALLDQHLIYKSCHTVYPGIPTGDYGNNVACFRLPNRFLCPADFLRHACTHNGLSIQQRPDQIHIGVIANDDLAFLQCIQCPFRYVLHRTWTETDDQQLALLSHPFFPLTPLVIRLMPQPCLSKKFPDTDVSLSLIAL